MPRRKRPPVETVNQVVPLQLPTVWDAWWPSSDGMTLAALRRFLEVMDEAQGTIRELGNQAEVQQWSASRGGAELAEATLHLWMAATQEREADNDG